MGGLNIELRVAHDGAVLCVFCDNVLPISVNDGEPQTLYDGAEYDLADVVASEEVHVARLKQDGSLWACCNSCFAGLEKPPPFEPPV